MKRLAIVLMLLLAVRGLSQTPAQLVEETKKLYAAFDEIDIDKLSTMLLSDAEPNVIYEKLDSYFLNDDQKFRYVFTNVKYNFGPVKTIDGRLYCAINFRNVIRITYFKPINVNDVMAMLKIKFNSSSVVYEKARNSFLIVYNAKMVAAQAGDVWQFAFVDDTLPKDISGEVIAENVKNELGL